MPSRLRSPFAAALAWPGIDLVNMANNHSMDYLRRGYRQTESDMKKVWALPTPGRPTRSGS